MRLRRAASVALAAKPGAYVVSVGLDSGSLRRGRRSRRRARRVLWLSAALAAAVVAGFAAALVWWSSARLVRDASALARVELQPLAGSLLSARAVGPDGSRIPLSVSGGRLTPRVLIPA